jgi:hypothetical protein
VGHHDSNRGAGGDKKIFEVHKGLLHRDDRLPDPADNRARKGRIAGDGGMKASDILFDAIATGMAFTFFIVFLVTIMRGNPYFSVHEFDRKFQWIELFLFGGIGYWGLIRVYRKLKALEAIR